jgi:hypothetical protein
MSLITRSFKTDRDRVIESGVISEAGMKELDALLMPGGKPGKFALALSAGSPDPLYTRVCDILRRNPGVKVNNEIPRDVQARAEAEDEHPTFAQRRQFRPEEARPAGRIAHGAVGPEEDGLTPSTPSPLPTGVSHAY